MRWLFALLAAALISSCGEDVYFIAGTAELPNCEETPVANLDGTTWFDQGTVTILTEGCEGASPGQMFQSCALNWVFTQTGNDVTIIVDAEYRIEGRLCGDQLYLRGGWWLPVFDDEVNACTYDDDSAEEVGILAEGNVLTYTAGQEQDPAQMTGTLSVRGPCSAEYEVTFGPS